MLTVIISTFNEDNNPVFYQAVERLTQAEKFEIICVDGGSSDSTLDKLKSYDVEIILLPNSTRAARLNKGVEQAKFTNVLLHHPRSILSNAAIDYLINNNDKNEWAAFTHKFDTKHFFLRFISWYSNNIRVKKKNIVYLDHCILVAKKYLTQPIPDIAIFEDTALSDILAKQGLTAKLLPHIATTSAIRFINRGIYKQFCMNQFLKMLYKLNFNAQIMNKIYEKKLDLNQKN